MISPRQTRHKLLKIAEPVCTGAGYELVDLKFVNEGSWVVRVYIDFPPPHGEGGPQIGFDDCERISRELSAVLDVEDPVPQAYRLEVSSPGVDRPLRTAEHFRRFAGERARVTLAQAQDGRRNFTGVLLGVEETEDGTAVHIDTGGEEFRLPLAEITNARLVPDWDQLMAGSQ